MGTGRDDFTKGKVSGYAALHTLCPACSRRNHGVVKQPPVIEFYQGLG